jgi:hypothetical protein
MERYREKKKGRRGFNKLLHTPIEHEAKKRTQIVAQQVAVMMTLCNTR